MCDDNDYAGFPQGSDGISSLEQWGAVKATGDQRRVADAIYPQQPIIALVYVCAPIAQPIDFVFSGISHVDGTTTAAINAAIDEVFSLRASPVAKFCGHHCCWPLGKSLALGGLLCNLRQPILSCKPVNSPLGVQ